MQFSFQSDIGVGTQRTFSVRPSLILYFIAAIMLLFAVVFHFAAGSVAREAELLAAEGKEAEATVTDRRVVESRDVKRDSDGDTRIETDIDYYLTLVFATADGTTVEIEKSVSNHVFNKHDTGDTLSIRYASSDPTVTEFEKGSREGEADIFKWLSWGFGALCVVLVGAGVMLRRKPAA